MVVASSRSGNMRGCELEQVGIGNPDPIQFQILNEIPDLGFLYVEDTYHLVDGKTVESSPWDIWEDKGVTQKPLTSLVAHEADEVLEVRDTSMDWFLAFLSCADVADDAVNVGRVGNP